MTYDSGLHRYLLTLTYSYSANPPAVWKRGAEPVIADSPTPWRPYSFVAASHDFGPSNGYGAGFPSEWTAGGGDGCVDAGPSAGPSQNRNASPH